MEKPTVKETASFQELRATVAQHADTFTFACGGSIPVFPLIVVDTSPDGPVDHHSNGPSPPVDIRWDHGATPGHIAKITLPLTGTDESTASLDALLAHMLPATFGRGHMDVLDESYRKAGQMDPASFSTSFCPYRLGIVDAIAQALLPSLPRYSRGRGVRAELYKMNTYSAPSGVFKAHVDTPRSTAQFGSLVVCLPLAHEGGVLDVRHNGRAVSFDWGANAQAISWAAFYSDCEHEVFEVTAGHRLTLTYNLCCVRGSGQLGEDMNVLVDPTLLPLYETARRVVELGDVWSKGGYIGFHCTHAYPHVTVSSAIFAAPDNLKGADVVLYTIFRHLGLEISFRPLLECDYGFELADGVNRSFDNLFGINEFYDYRGKQDEDLKRWAGQRPQRHNYVPWGAVNWINQPVHDQPQLVCTIFGNQPMADVIYSYFTIIAEVPPRA